MISRLPARHLRARLSDQAATHIKGLIAKGAYGSGSKLPSEKLLAEEIGVTRLTLREALSQLEATGLVDTRHGTGTFVADLSAGATFRLLEELLRAGRALTPSECISLMEFREVVMGGFAKHLIARARPEHLDDLRALVTKARAVAGHPAELASLDFQFNEVLARASGNLFQTLLLRSVREMHEYLGTVIFGELSDDEAILKTQSAIIKALASRNQKKLDRALTSYLAGGTRIVSEWLERAKKKTNRER